MNDRMYELINQCFIATTDGELSQLNTVSNIEKFAELIVKECIAKVELRKKFAIEDEHIVEHAFDLLVYDLESHFGVEE